MNRYWLKCSRSLVLFISIVVGGSKGVPANGKGVDLLYFPDGDGNIQFVNLTEGNDETRIGKADITQSVWFELYTRDQQNISLQLCQSSDKDTFLVNFRPNLETKIIIHGWQSDTDSVFVQSLKDSYLKSRDCNVIAVLWPSKSLNYPMVAVQTEVVGTLTAQLIDFLHDTLGTSMKLVHIIGHSLGAHVAGFAGSTARNTIPRITGLDPALPGFAVQTTDSRHRLDPSDADFVDVIHTGGGLYGILDSIGTVDFYPNEGTPPQPGCGVLDQLNACSHGRSYMYFNESIMSATGFWGHACEYWLDYSLGLCPEPTTLMGDHVALDARGKMFLHTNEQQPFAKGRV